MRFLLAILVAVVVVAPAVAHDLGARAPTKPPSHQPPPPADPEVIRQGGDTMVDAPLLTLPTVDLTGSTTGYTHDYDEACPYTDSVAPDVVYRLAPQADTMVDIDMWGSSYDTKIYVYREDLTVVACNDDYYADYVSLIQAVLLEGGVKYFLVIDGYGSESGEYLLNIHPYCPCQLDCPAGAPQENEPPLVDNYEDAHNGGCNSPQFGFPFQSINSLVFCGVSGWYDYLGEDYRDTDWFEIIMPYWGELIVTADAEVATRLYELGPHDCYSVEVLQEITVGPCGEGTIIMTGEAGSTVWLWVGPTGFTPPNWWTDGEYDYVLHLELPWSPVTVEARNWSSVKSLFR